METISIKRIGQLWRFYWRTEKTQYLRLFLMFLAIFLVKTAAVDFLLTRINIYLYDFSHYSFHQWIYWGGIFITLSYLFDAIHQKQRAIDYLCLPSNNGEKFISRLLLGIIGVPILVNTAVLASSVIVTLFLGTIDNIAGNQPEWEKIFDYYYFIAEYHEIKEMYLGFIPFDTLIRRFLWQSMIAWMFYSLFIWFGTAFRKAGWVYAFISFFVVGAIIAISFEVMDGKVYLEDKELMFYIISTAAILIIIISTLLAYRSFCRAQVVNHKFVTL